MTSRSRTLFTAFAASTIATCLTLAGCGKPASENPDEAATLPANANKIDVVKTGGTAQTTIKTDDSVTKISSGRNLTLPKDFPTDLHLPSTTYTVSNVVQNNEVLIVTLHASTPVSTLYAEYDTAMKSAGWKEAMAVQSSQSDALMSFQRDNRVVTVTLVAASGQAGGTNISLQHVVK